MKTSNKTNSRLTGFAIALMVMSLVSTNLNAQKFQENYTLASIDNSLYSSVRFESLNEYSINISNSSANDQEPLESWMMNPKSWNKNYTTPVVPEKNFVETEMILEDWMMDANWEDNSKFEEELSIEEWMVDADSWIK
jgi:hypothetical protein